MKTRRILGCFFAVVLSASTSSLATAQQPGFGDIVWYQIDSFCAFKRADHSFVYDDPASWRWVAFSNFPIEGEEPLDRLFMRVGGALREFNLAEMQEAGDVQQRVYVTSGDDPVRVEMQLVEGGDSYEATAYSGVLTETVSGDSVLFNGDCGV